MASTNPLMLSYSTLENVLYNQSAEVTTTRGEVMAIDPQTVRTRSPHISFHDDRSESKETLLAEGPCSLLALEGNTKMKKILLRFRMLPSVHTFFLSKHILRQQRHFLCRIVGSIYRKRNLCGGALYDFIAKTIPLSDRSARHEGWSRSNIIISRLAERGDASVVYLPLRSNNLFTNRIKTFDHEIASPS